MIKPRNENITARTDKETLQWFRQIAEKEECSISRVVHLALKKVKADYRQDEITKETKT